MTTQFIEDTRVTTKSNSNEDAVLYLDRRRVARLPGNDVSDMAIADRLEDYLGCYTVVAIDGGWMAFDTVPEYRTWNYSI